MKPKVSIAIPAYNVAEYISECLRSVCSQTFPDLEIIVVNDGSTDDTAAIVSDFSDKRIRLINQENKGVATARNRAIAEATADFVLCVDSDDVLHRETVQVCYNLAIEQKVDCVTFDAQDFYMKNGKRHNVGDYFDRGKCIAEGVYTGKTFLESEVEMQSVVVCIYTNFIRREILQATPFKDGIIHEDVLFHYELFPKIPQLYYLPRVFYERRLRAGSIIHSTPTMLNVDSYEYVFEQLLKKYKYAKGQEQKLYRKILKKNVMQLAKTAKRYVFSRQKGKGAVLTKYVKLLCTGDWRLIVQNFIYFKLAFLYFVFTDPFRRKVL